jgi:hypothetical protein
LLPTRRAWLPGIAERTHPESAVVQPETDSVHGALDVFLAALIGVSEMAPPSRTL